MPRQFTLKLRHFFALFLALQFLSFSMPSYALPSFARQTGQNCVACHAGGQFPELTSFGRLFKLTGYTIGTKGIPLSIMGVASRTKSASPTEDSAFAKDGAALFQTGSVFLAGKITDNIGVFAQATYNNYNSQNPDNGKWQGKWAADNIDIRYADRFGGTDKDLIVGFNVNNNPSIADPWNTAPAWIQYVPTGFGVTGSDAGPIVSQLGAQAAGVGAYAFWNNKIYAEISGYQTAKGIWSFLSPGTAREDQVQLKGINPYIRVALNHDWGPHSAMVGMFTMTANVYPDNLNASGSTTHYRDHGVDAQYQYILDPHTITAQLSYIREAIDHGDLSGTASNAANNLNQIKMKASYVYRAKYGASLGYFSTTGSSDATLYADSATNPDTRGWTPEAFWTPIEFVRVGVQYFKYNRFHGAANNYDGAGRNAKDNNTTFLYVWGAY